MQRATPVHEDHRSFPFNAIVDLIARRNPYRVFCVDLPCRYRDQHQLLNPM